MQYSVRATIRHADQLLFTTDTHYPVLTRGAGNTADVLLIMVERNR
jgi:putative lipoprotein